MDKSKEFFIKKIIFLFQNDQRSFFSDAPWSLNTKSLDFTSLLAIDRNIFLTIIKDYPEDYEKFCHIKDSINLYNDYTGLLLVCYSNKFFFLRKINYFWLK